jgi:hypothetical protein
MDLPIELRLRIYELSILQDTAICINRAWQLPSLLTLGPKFPDHDIVAEIFYKHNTFVYYLTSYTFSSIDVSDLIHKLSLRSPKERSWLWTLNVECFWAAKDVTIEQIKAKVDEAMSAEGLVLGGGKEVVRFFHTNDVWQRTWFG